jgi:peptide/nickel transport system substrate-binding protein
MLASKESFGALCHCAAEYLITEAIMKTSITVQTTLVITLALLASTAQAQGKSFRWSNNTDTPTLDIHAQNNATANGVVAAFYESLVYYNSRNFKLEPVLALRWQELSPTQYRFALRPNVKFSDGSVLSADDVVFSLQRALAKNSKFTVYTQGMDKVAKVNANTVDIFLKSPNPVLLNQLTELRIMSKAWAEKNNSVEPKDIVSKDETFAHRNAMGTGPFMLKEWQPDQKLVMVRNPNWWGWAAGAGNSNVNEVVFTPLRSDATRMAALLSGELDFVLDPRVQDLTRLRSNEQFKVMDGVENRTHFYGMDQFRDELVGSNIKGKNPLKDIRVRRALYQAIDMETISRVTLRGNAQATGAMVAPMVAGWSEAVHKRLPLDVEAAKKLMLDAGYKDGFEVDFACPNDYREEICNAVSAMWAKIGVRAKLRTMPAVAYFPMLQRYEASIYMLSWGVPTFDTLYSAQSLLRSVVPGTGDGNFNIGRYKSERMDYVIDRVKAEGDLQVRNRLLTEALQLSNDTVSHIPLFNSIIPWAMKKNVEVIHRADNRIDWRFVRVN